MRLITLTALTGLLFWAAGLDAQQNGNLPTVVQSCNSNITAGTPCALNKAVQSGDTVVAGFCWEDTGSPVAISSCTDTNGIIPTITVGSLSHNGSCQASGDVDCAIQFAWGKATSTGAPSISCVTSFPRQNISTTIELSGNLNSTADAQGTASTSGANPAVSVTTTQQNDVVVSGMCASPNPLSVFVPSTNLLFGAQAVTADLNPLMEEVQRAGAAGTVTSTFNGAAVQTALAAVAFKPTSAALTIGSTLLPDGGENTPYSACLTAWGGNGSSLTWSITSGSLPSGLSLGSSTGCITGTPSATGNPSLAFKVTDGTNNGTATLPLNIVLSLSTIGTPSCSTFTTNPASASVPAQAGSAVLLCGLQDDTHGNTGYEIPASYMSDNLGDVYVRADPIAGGQAGALQCFTTKAVASGSLTPSYNGFGGSPLAGVLCSVPGAQQIVDPVVINQSYPGAVSSMTLTSSYTTPVPNGLLLTLSTLNCQQGGGGSCSMSTSTNSPFVSLASVTGFAGVPFAVYQQSAPTVTSYSATSNFADATSASMVADTPLQTMVFLRPAAPTQGTFSGEKVRRYVN